MTKPLRNHSREQPLRAAIVGAGYIAEFHAQALRRKGSIELVAVCDSNRSLADAFAARWAIDSVFGDVEAMFAQQEFDVLHVLVPPDRHHRIAKMALESKRHVFLEKPM